MPETLDYYNAHAKALCSQYDKAIPEAFHRLLARWITPNTSVLELGCGSGRDARFMARLGARVTATDGSAGMLSEARERKGKPIYRLLSLPASASDVARLRTDNSDKAFDVVVASAVLMHLNDEAFFRTARNIAELTKEDGLLILSVPLGHPADDTRFYAARPVEAMRFTLEDFGFQVLAAEKTNDAAKRAFAWVTLVLRKSRQISRRRQKLQSVLFEDRKTSTYKLALCGRSAKWPQAMRTVPVSVKNTPLPFRFPAWSKNGSDTTGRSSGHNKSAEHGNPALKRP